MPIYGNYAFVLFLASKGFWAQTLGVGDFYYEVREKINNIINNKFN